MRGVAAVEVRRRKSEGGVQLNRHISPPAPLDAEAVRVRPSPIHGLGAFAARHIPKGTVLGRYEGEHIDQSEYDRKYPRGDPVYVLQLEGKRGYIDGAASGHWSARINAARDAQPNVRFGTGAAEATIRATRAIAAGEELLIRYGPHYRFEPR